MVKNCPRYYMQETRKEVQKTDPGDGTVTILIITKQEAMQCNEECALYEFRPKCGPN
jgi:hypothetical protein